MSNKEIDSIQIGGNHYKTEKFMQQHWNVMILCNASYLQGCITKYLDRFDKKNGLAYRFAKSDTLRRESTG